MILSILRSWWVLAFALLCGMLYEQGLKKNALELAQLKQKLHQLELEKAEQLKIQADLTLQIKSQNDPAWVEYVLMKELGVIPEESKKVYFKSSPSS